MSTTKSDTAGVVLCQARQSGNQTSRDVQQRAESMSPIFKAWEDIVVLLNNLVYLPDLALPVKKLHARPGVPKGPSVFWRDYTLVALLTVIQVPLIVLVIPTYLLLPGVIFITLYALFGLLLWPLVRLLWGPILIHSCTTGFDVNKFPHERWVFINGVATGHLAAQRSANNLAATFQRPFTGIYNRTLGVVGDLIECLIQRSFGYSTFDVRVAIECLSDFILDEQVHKIVVIAHSQGGIIMSLALDHLYTVMPPEALRKLEIYTFGNAAAQFHDPLAQIKNGKSLSTKQVVVSGDEDMREHLIPYIEHYCNENDPVPRWGVLYHISRASTTTYAGRVFVRENASGHFFDQHYLDAMFPTDKTDDEGDPTSFLNNGIRYASGNVYETKTLHGLVRRVNGVASAEKEDVVGLRVRDVSRLAKYLLGREPDK